MSNFIDLAPELFRPRPQITAQKPPLRFTEILEFGTSDIPNAVPCKTVTEALDFACVITPIPGLEEAMKKSITKLFSCFTEFWWHVYDAEHDIHRNYDNGKLDLACARDPWDEGFARDYDKIRPLLGKLRKRRFYAVPMGLTFRTGPIAAESGHQALMFFLNRPEELYGEGPILNTPEYLAIKKSAQDELLQVQAKRLSPPTPTPPREDKLREAELARLSAYIRSDMAKQEEETPGHSKPRTWHAFSQRFGWSQSTVGRRMHEFYYGPAQPGECLRGMANYRSFFVKNAPRPGFVASNGDTAHIEGVCRDEMPDLDEGDTESST